jgi:hypothetical protein
MSPRKANSRPARQEHCIIDLTLPAADAPTVLPFTAKVIVMPVSEQQALVFDRRDESLARIGGLAGAAIRAAKRRDPSKRFTTRQVTHQGVDTYAVWRLA